MGSYSYVKGSFARPRLTRSSSCSQALCLSSKTRCLEAAPRTMTASLQTLRYLAKHPQPLEMATDTGAPIGSWSLRDVAMSVTSLATFLQKVRRRRGRRNPRRRNHWTAAAVAPQPRPRPLALPSPLTPPPSPSSMSQVYSKDKSFAPLGNRIRYRYFASSIVGVLAHPVLGGVLASALEGTRGRLRCHIDEWWRLDLAHCPGFIGDEECGWRGAVLHRVAACLPPPATHPTIVNTPALIGNVGTRKH